MWDAFHAVVETELRRLYIYGPPGIGKSHASHDIGAQTGKQPYQITLNEDVSVPEVIGCYIPAGDKFVWHDGPIAAAMREGIPLIINEISRSSGAVQDMLLAVLDDPSIASIALPSGERLKPAPGFRVFATANTAPDDLDDALRDRFDAVIHVTTPHPALVQKLNSLKNGLGDFILDSYKDSSRSISPRKAFAFYTMLKHTTAEIAAPIIFEGRSEDVLMALQERGVV